MAQSPDLPAPTRPTRRPTSDPAACWSLQCHQPQHRLLPTSLCRVEPLEQVPLEPIEVRRTLDYTPVFKPHIIEVFIAGDVRHRATTVFGGSSGGAGSSAELLMRNMTSQP